MTTPLFQEAEQFYTAKVHTLTVDVGAGVTSLEIDMTRGSAVAVPWPAGVVLRSVTLIDPNGNPLGALNNITGDPLTIRGVPATVQSMEFSGDGGSDLMQGTYTVSLDVAQVFRTAITISPLP